MEWKFNNTNQITFYCLSNLFLTFHVMDNILTEILRIILISILAELNYTRECIIKAIKKRKKKKKLSVFYRHFSHIN